MKRGLIITGGTPPSKELLEREIEAADGIICADHGFDALGAIPEKLLLVVGDFDSAVRTQEIQRPEIPAEILSPMKDETDTEMALLRMLEYKPEEIRILGGTGSRIDHSLATIFSLEAYVDGETRILLVDDSNRLEILGEGRYTFSKDGYTYISLLPLTDSAIVSTEGMKYEISALSLMRKRTRGVSNEILDNTGTITIHKGHVVVVQSSD
ncbi:Thiamine pyrophosphokinase [Aedoeadaptatus ivorii]|uniref:Thiamine diphosphokinase n=1 Tax=Aedoeadaptatus ivorii TaxID=54006 RepID=A0A448V1J6_9FIRM|nr:thiamine diphosphokinase [Peptoniphilus ivorii]VEJ35603.1 Thiamine pyrophosphokinase [Peptoniphilus ivorii]